MLPALEFILDAASSSSRISSAESAAKNMSSGPTAYEVWKSLRAPAPVSAVCRLMTTKPSNATHGAAANRVFNSYRCEYGSLFCERHRQPRQAPALKAINDAIDWLASPFVQRSGSLIGGCIEGGMAGGRSVGWRESSPGLCRLPSADSSER